MHPHYFCLEGLFLVAQLTTLIFYKEAIYCRPTRRYCIIFYIFSNYTFYFVFCICICICFYFAEYYHLTAQRYNYSNAVSNSNTGAILQPSDKCGHTYKYSNTATTAITATTAATEINPITKFNS